MSPADAAWVPILVVDDDDRFAGEARTLLEGAGYRTLTAASGEEGLAMARERSPLVVLLSIELPGLNGYEVCRALRDEHGRGVAIALVSGIRTDAIDVSSGLLVGADDYFVKPYDPTQLVARVGALLRRVRPEKADENHGPGRLTAREVEILGLLADGLGQKEIAKSLSISPKTVAVHIDHILGKLRVHSRAQAVAAAYRKKLVNVPRQPLPGGASALEGLAGLANRPT